MFVNLQNSRKLHQCYGDKKKFGIKENLAEQKLNLNLERVKKKKENNVAEKG